MMDFEKGEGTDRTAAGRGWQGRCQWAEAGKRADPQGTYKDPRRRVCVEWRQYSLLQTQSDVAGSGEWAQKASMPRSARSAGKTTPAICGQMALCNVWRGWLLLPAACCPLPTARDVGARQTLSQSRSSIAATTRPPPCPSAPGLTGTAPS
ncbi:hypothetical protein AcV7_003801 [Taiwanofungus camphoratus]|nr:hypothetical protein AcV7_003801 [Antrodia cinnamomea]